MKTAIIASTDRGVRLALRLHAALPEAELVSTRASDDPRVRPIVSIAAFLAGRFADFDALVFIGALGICVRSIAPHIVDKHCDPAVVNLDEAGCYVQPVLSGHVGGANDLARHIARALGAEPVVTTASDVQDLWALDLLGPANGWTPSATPDVTTAIALYVNRRPTALLLDVRDRGTRRLERSLAAHVTLFRRFEDIDFAAVDLLIAVTYRRYEAPVPVLHLWARALCVGVGCTRGSDPAALAASAERLLRDAGLAPEAVLNVASTRLRHDERALIAWADSLGARFDTFEETSLGTVPVPNPSPVVEARVGTPSVAEAAALQAAGQTELLMPKRKAALPDGQHHTLAVAVARRMQRRASIAIVGAGPGDPELISVRGRQLLQEADLVLYAGSLVPAELVAGTRPGAEVRSSAGLDLEQQIDLMAAHYARGHQIVRLHTGDPCLYGAIQEHMAEFDARDWEYVIVPGISAFQAAAARLRSQFTVPGEVQTVILTRGAGETPVPDRERLADLARHRATLCIYLSVGLADDVQRALLEHYPAATPVALLYRVTWPDERVFTGTLSELSDIVRAQHLTRTTLIVVGDAIGARRNRSHLYDAAKGHGYRDPRNVAGL